LLAARGAQERGLWRVHCRRIALFSIGLAAPLALTALILWQAGVFQRFWFWTVVYAGAHTTVISWSSGRVLLAEFLRSLPLTGDGLFWIVAGLGMVSLALAKGERRKKYWMTGFLIFSVMAVSLSNYFTGHYFVMLLPALCLFVGQAVSAAMQRTGNPDKAWVALPAALFASIWMLAVFHHRAVFFVFSPDQVCKKVFGSNPFLESAQIGHYIGEHSPPGARVAILGSEPEILFYARRHSATGYIYMYDLMEGPEPHAGEMQREMIAQIEAARPEYLVFVKTRTSWGSTPYSLRGKGAAVITWAAKFMDEFYEPIGLVNVMQPDSEYYWEKDALAHQPSAEFIGILKRK
jgi:hypothetical protein